MGGTVPLYPPARGLPPPGGAVAGWGQPGWYFCWAGPPGRWHLARWRPSRRAETLGRPRLRADLL